MKRVCSAKLPKAFCAITFVAASALAQANVPAPTVPTAKPPAQVRHVMAPPPATRAAAKLRPSTAEAGQARNVRQPLKQMPAFASAAAGPGTGTSPSGHTGHWLLLYRTEHCIPCDRLMNVLAASDSADLRAGVPYTVVVGGSSSSAVAAVRAKYSTLSAASWVADADRSRFKELQLQGSPELFALDGSRIVWRISGNLGDSKQVLHRADAWIAGTAAADAAAREKAAAAAKLAVSASAPTAIVKR